MAMELLNLQHVEHRLLLWRATYPDFVALLERYGAPAPALRHFGLIRWQTLQFELAIEAFTAALSIEPDDPSLWSDLAGVYQSAARHEMAAICLRSALDRDAQRAGNWLMLATIEAQAGRIGEAENAYHRALSVDPEMADAHFGLGILCFNARRPHDAADHLRRAIECSQAHVMAHLCLGHVLYRLADFPACVGVFEAAALIQPLDANGRQKYVRARTFAAMLDGDCEAALGAYAALAGDDAEPVDVIARDAFSLFSAHGHTEAALAVGRLRLARNPADPVQRYLLDVVAGVPVTSVPADYIESYFDGFAEGFDQKLVEVLAYGVPQDLTALLARHRTAFSAMLDLGCGTGLAAEPLARLGADLVGVDLAARMLDQAARRGRYRDLVKAEASAFLNLNPGRFDLIFAADLLIYFAALDQVMAAAARALVPGGLFAVSTERSEAGDIALLNSGRFAHADAYVRGVSAQDFEVLEETATILRLDGNGVAQGTLFVLRRR